MDEAEEEIEADEDDELKTIVYDNKRKGFYVKRRLNFENDVRLLAECVYATKFVDAGTAEMLIDTVCSLVSDYQAEKIRQLCSSFLCRGQYVPAVIIEMTCCLVISCACNRNRDCV